MKKKNIDDIKTELISEKNKDDNGVSNDVGNDVGNDAGNDVGNDLNIEKNNKNIDSNKNNIGELNITTNDLSELEIIDDNILNSLVESKEKKNKESNKTITLKKPDEVYLELYKEAREKAKEAKKNAISAYLKAKQIKDTYSLEEIDDSDDDINDLLNN